MSELRKQKGLRALRHLSRQFAANRSGTVAIIFALTAFTIIALVGGAVDYGRWYSAKVQMQGALDSAVLAAGRALQTTNNNQSVATDMAKQYFDRMKSPIPIRESSNFVVIENGTKVRGTSDSFIATPFLSMVGLYEMPIYISADAVVQVGGNAEQSIETALMLDVTGSMAGQKILDLKQAAKDLIDIIVWTDQSQYTSKVAIAPFSQSVYVGDYFQTLTNQNPAGSPAVPAVPPTYSYPSSCYRGNGSLRSSCEGNSAYMTNPGSPAIPATPAKGKCVVERAGANEFTETVPSGAGSWLTPYYDAYKSAHGVNPNPATSCTPSVQIVPLTNNKDTLKGTVDSFVASGSTAGELGTAWAWYLLSPSWSGVWPAASRPAAYSELTQLNANGQPRLKKIAVLMTDGEYNYRLANDANSTTVSNNAKTLCTNMKAKGIEVYTVGFQLDVQLAKDTLRDCATDSSHFYDASNGEELRQAFRDIALKIATLRLAL
jgi:Flp pilus assembly protein TadG